VGYVVLVPVLQRYPPRSTFEFRARRGRFVVRAQGDAAALGLVSLIPEEIDRHLSVLEYLAASGLDPVPGPLWTEMAPTLGDRVEKPFPPWSE